MKFCSFNLKNLYVFLYINISIVLVYFSNTFINSHSHKCGIEYLQAQRKLSKIPGDSQNRYLSSAEYEPIRIHLDYSMIENNLEKFNKEDLIDLKNRIMPKTKEIFEKLLKVKRLEGKLKFDTKYCDNILMPESFHEDGEGVNADLVIFVMIDDTGFFLENQIEAAAIHCLQHAVTRRPVGGYIQFKPNLEVSNSTALDYQVWLAVHEISHVLAMNDMLYPDFISESNDLLGIDKVVGTKKIRSNIKTKKTEYEEIGFINSAFYKMTRGSYNSNRNNESNGNKRNSGTGNKGSGDTNNTSNENTSSSSSTITNSINNNRGGNNINENHSNKKHIEGASLLRTTTNENVNENNIKKEEEDKMVNKQLNLRSFGKETKKLRFKMKTNTHIHEHTHWHSYSHTNSNTNKHKPINPMIYNMPKRTNQITLSKEMNYIKSPKVLEKAKEHYKCDDLFGVPLEYNGGPGTAGAHWSKRYMNTDYMIGDSYGENLISEITLALFEDSGWYRIDYSMANIMNWGKGKGCAFFHDQCVVPDREAEQDGEQNPDNNSNKDNDFPAAKRKSSSKKKLHPKEMYYLKTEFEDEFCIHANKPVCSTHSIFRGTCAVRRYKSELPTKEKHFSDSKVGGIDPLTDKCPIVVEDRGNQVYYGGSCRVGRTIEKFDKICPECACFMTSLRNEESKSKKELEYKATCLEFKCEKSGELHVSINGKKYICNEEGKITNIYSFQGEVTCPKKELLCDPRYLCKFGCTERYSNKKGFFNYRAAEDKSFEKTKDSKEIDRELSKLDKEIAEIKSTKSKLLDAKSKATK